MTSDEFDQKRRELIAMRTKYAGREEVTNRINNLLGQLTALQDTPSGSHRGQLLDLVERSMTELARLTSQ